MLIDSHAHLDDRRFADDLEATLERARQAGVRHIITVGCGPDSSQAAAAIARAHPGFISATAGVHPHDADHADGETRRRIEQMVLDRQVVAVGEAGLDFFYNHSSRTGQLAAFQWQIELALKAKLPLIVHCRDAYDECLGMLSRYKGAGLRGAAHCFSGNETHARAFLCLGFHISFAGPLTFPKAEGLRNVARQVPAERLLLETDCPYLTPQPKRGGRNEPAFVSFTASVLDGLADLNPTRASEYAARNAVTLFALPPLQGVAI